MVDQSPHDDDLEAYVLGTLSGERLAAFRQRLAGSPELRARVAQAQAVTALLAETPPTLNPSPDLKQRLLAAVAAERAAPDGAPAAPVAAGDRAPAVPGKPVGAAPRPAQPWATWLAAAALLLAVGLGFWNGVLQQRLGLLQSQVDHNAEALSALAGPDRVWTMSGVPQYAPQAVSTLALNRREQRTVLLVKGFPPLAADRTYQVWVVQSGRQVPIGTFRPSTIDSEVTLVIPSDLAGVSRAMITVEPFGGSPLPTGQTVMEGDL